MRNVDKIKSLEKELGKYQKKVADQGKLLRKLRDELERVPRRGHPAPGGGGRPAHGGALGVRGSRQGRGRPAAELGHRA